MNKYNFYEIRKIPRNQPIPEDVNEPVENIALKIGGEKLIAALAKMRKERLYGDILHVNKNNVVDGQFTFQDGMCTRFKLIELKDKEIIVQRSIHNSNLYMRKNFDHDDETTQ